MALVTAKLAPETIQSAAIKLKDGSIYTGATHALAIIAAENAIGRPVRDELTFVDPGGLLTGGFVTSTGRLVGRHEANCIADAAQQGKSSEATGLISESLRRGTAPRTPTTFA